MELNKLYRCFFLVLLVIYLTLIAQPSVNATLQHTLMPNILLNRSRDHCINKRNNAWYVGIEAGYTFFYKPRYQLIATATGYPPDTYNYLKADKNAIIAINGGWQYDLGRYWLSRFTIGVAVHHSSTSFRGTINSYSIPSALNYNYKYRIQYTSLFFTVSSSIFSNSHFSWFVNMGIGPAYLSAFNYSEQPIAGAGGRTDLGFNEGHNWNIGYMVGTGISFVLPKNWSLLIKYQYVNYGKTHLHPGKIRPGIIGLSPKIRANIVLMGLRFKI